MRNAVLDELQAGIKIGRRNINNLRYVYDTTLMAEREEELKSLLMRVKEESERASLKLNTKKTKMMTSCPITSWQIEGEKVEAVTDFVFLGSKITADGAKGPGPHHLSPFSPPDRDRRVDSPAFSGRFRMDWLDFLAV